MEILSIFAAMLTLQLSSSNYMSNSVKSNVMTAASNVSRVGCMMESTVAPQTTSVLFLVTLLRSIQRILLDVPCRKPDPLFLCDIRLYAV